MNKILVIIYLIHHIQLFRERNYELIQSYLIFEGTKYSNSRSQ
jgi:hypothetical protein